MLSLSQQAANLTINRRPFNRIVNTTLIERFSDRSLKFYSIPIKQGCNFSDTFNIHLPPPIF